MHSVNRFPISSKGLSPENQLGWLLFEITAEILIDTQLNIAKADDLYQHVTYAINRAPSIASQVRMAEAILDKKAWRVLL